MSDNKQPAKTEQRIPVRRIVFLDKRHINGAGVTDTLLGDAVQENKPRFVIEYIPAMRHHRIAYFAPSAKTPAVTMIPEAAVAEWEPGAL